MTLHPSTVSGTQPFKDEDFQLVQPPKPPPQEEIAGPLYWEAAYKLLYARMVAQLAKAREMHKAAYVEDLGEGKDNAWDKGYAEGRVDSFAGMKAYAETVLLDDPCNQLQSGDLP
jgi:flagellar biosynthesis/type III secretory pathway protein FliH